MLTIAVIGPTWLKRRIHEAFAMFPNITMHYFETNDISELMPNVVHALRQAHCILFTHRAYEQYVREQRQLPIPTYYVPLKGGCIYEAYFQLVQQQKITTLSVDGMELAYLTQPLTQMNQACTTAAVTYQLTDEAETVKAHLIHCHHLKHGVMTCSHYVAQELQARGITVVLLKPTIEDVVVLIERILLSTDERRQKEHQIVLGKIEVHSQTLLNESFKSQSLKKYKVDRIVANFADELNGYLLPTTTLQYNFICHRGEFERITEGYKVLPVLRDIFQIEQAIICCGVGFGMTIQAAAAHADIALTQAQQHKTTCAFIVTEQRNVFGPITVDAPVVYSLTNTRINDKQAYQLEKVRAYVQKNERTIFTSNDVALVLQITVRTANRLLTQWVDANYIDIHGVERVNRKGRPRQYYTFVDV